ncbi:MAG: hypothetical protein CMIDDMOC_00161 [Sodalis sp. Fle]|nr:MAG: hypothetical protein CMIDDMOC_00161 [Sodalis sp. Fle]
MLNFACAERGCIFYDVSILFGVKIYSLNLLIIVNTIMQNLHNSIAVQFYQIADCIYADYYYDHAFS